MDICIYTKKTVGKFHSREHIVPAFIGGITKLPLGYVEHSVNNLFSRTIEDRCSHFSPVGFTRDILGPGKRGSLDFASRPVIAEDREIGSIFVIGTQMGAAIIPQFIIEEKYLNYRIVNLGVDKACQTDLVGLLMKEIPQKSIFIEDCFATVGRYIVTQHKDKWYVSGRTHKNIEHIQFIIRHGSNAFAGMSAEVTKTIDDELFVGKVMKYDDSTPRVVAKILFNFLAYDIGNEKATLSRYDVIRNYIIKGDEANELKWDVMDGVFDDQYLRDLLGLNRDAHIVIIFNEIDKLYGVVQLYGSYLYNLEIEDGYSGPDIFKVLYCDWRKREERIINDLELKRKVVYTHDAKYRCETVSAGSIPSNVLGVEFDEVLRESFRKNVLTVDADVTFYYDTRKTNSYSEIERIDGKWNYYIDLRRGNHSVRQILLQGFEYINMSNQFKHAAGPKNFQALGEKDIANYINNITSFSIVDKSLRDKGLSFESEYIQRFQTFTNQILNWDNNSKERDFFIVKFTLQLVILSYYDEQYSQDLSEMLNKISPTIISNCNLILSALRAVKDICIERGSLILWIIELLNIESHIQVGLFRS